MDNAIKVILLVSVLANILFLFLANKLIAKKGGLSFLVAKSFLAIQKIRQGEGARYSPYYLRRKDQLELLESLPRDTSEIIFLGDSITEEAEWAELFKPLNVKNRGISGDTTIGLLNRLNKIIEPKPQKVFLMIGINDFLNETKSVLEISQIYRAIFIKIQEQTLNTEVFVQSVLPVNNQFYRIKVDNKNVVTLNAQLQELAKEFSYQYIDLFSHFLDQQDQLDPQYTLDGIHLNGQAYLLWKQIIEQYVTA
jgi:lysophospholipase L1-like esterase